MSSSFLLLSLLAFLALAEPLEAQPEVCLFHPFITSILRTTYRETRQVPFTFELRLNYETDILISNFQSNKTTYTTGRGILLGKVPSNDVQSIYRRKLFDNGKIFDYKKQDYVKHLDTELARHRIDDHIKRSARDVASTCGAPYFYEADYLVYLNTTHSLHVIYHKAKRCYAVKTLSELEKHDYHNGYREIHKHSQVHVNVIAASYNEPFLIEVTSGNWLVIKEFRVDSKPSAELPLGGELVRLNQYSLATWSLAPPLAVLGNERCRFAFSKVPLSNPHLAVMSRSNLEDPPHNSFTWFLGLDSERIMLIPSNGKWRTFRANGTHFREGFVTDFLLQWFGGKRPPMIETSNIGIEAIAIQTKSEDSPLQIEAFLYDHNKHLTFYLKFTNAAHLFTQPEIIEHMSGYRAPDDITFWWPCRRIVVFYGFMYGIYDEAANIATDQVKWQKLDGDRVKARAIEAVTTIGDEFYFLTGQTTVLVLHADYSDCSKLDLTFKRSIRLIQMVDQAATVFLEEGRYFNGDQWIPPWGQPRQVASTTQPTNKTTTATPPTDTTATTTTTTSIPPEVGASDSLIWIYVGASVAILVLALVLSFVVLCLVRRCRRSTDYHNSIHRSDPRLKSILFKSTPSEARTYPIVNYPMKTLNSEFDISPAKKIKSSRKIKSAGSPKKSSAKSLPKSPRKSLTSSPRRSSTRSPRKSRTNTPILSLSSRSK